MPSIPNADMNMKANGTPPEFANTAQVLSTKLVNFAEAYFTMVNVKSAPISAEIIAVISESFILTTKA